MFQIVADVLPFDESNRFDASILTVRFVSKKQKKNHRIQCRSTYDESLTFVLS